jgi:tryptophan synthase alpha chain
MTLSQAIHRARADKDILLMTHLVLGYPSFAVNRQVIEQMVAAGVDIIELQIPFSEPVADGPVILRANQEAIASGVRVRDCLAFAAEMTARHPIPFLFMTYYNIRFKFGEEKFCDECRRVGVKGLIIPDLPPEMGPEFFHLAQARQLAPILIFAPTSTDARMAELNRHAAGFIYCTARRGVTGSKSEFGDPFNAYLGRCRAATTLPLAVGFGIRDRADVTAITGLAEMAVIGSQTIRLVDEKGPAAVGPFIAGLR